MLMSSLIMPEILFSLRPPPNPSLSLIADKGSLHMPGHVPSAGGTVQQPVLTLYPEVLPEPHTDLRWQGIHHSNETHLVPFFTAKKPNNLPELD